MASGGRGGWGEMGGRRGRGRGRGCGQVRYHFHRPQTVPGACVCETHHISISMGFGNPQKRGLPFSWYLLDEVVANGIRSAGHGGGEVEGSSNLSPHPYLGNLTQHRRHCCLNTA